VHHIAPPHAPQQAPHARSHGHRAADRRTFSSARPALAHDLGAARQEALRAQQDRPAFFRGDHSRGTFGLPRGQGGAPEDAVLDWAMQASLQERGLINWWAHGAALARLYPLETDADGDCLLHALSLALAGFHDRANVLRRALHHTMLGMSGIVFRQRWQVQMATRNRLEGFELEDHQWEQEWEALVIRAKQNNRSLEDVHVLVLAHVLARPIIIYASKVVRARAVAAAAPPPRRPMLAEPLPSLARAGARACVSTHARTRTHATGAGRGGGRCRRARAARRHLPAPGHEVGSLLQRPVVACLLERAFRAAHHRGEAKDGRRLEWPRAPA
jgi:hypothetical protein